MVDVAPLKPYLVRLEEKLATGDTTEHTHRSTLEKLVESLEDNVRAINEPRRIECGAPDLAVLRDGFMVGHIQAKDVGTALDTAERSEQLKRYRRSLLNLILTNYLELRWYVGGGYRRTVRLGRLSADDRLTLEKAAVENVLGLLSDFLAHKPDPIDTVQKRALQTCAVSPNLLPPRFTRPARPNAGLQRSEPALLQASAVANPDRVRGSQPHSVGV